MNVQAARAPLRGRGHPGDVFELREPVRPVVVSLSGMQRLDVIKDWLDRWPKAGGLLLIVVGLLLAVFGFQHDAWWNFIVGAVGLGLLGGGVRTLYMRFTHGHAYPPYDRE